jgi:hypothetical protein
MKQQTGWLELHRPTAPYSHTDRPTCPPGFTLILSVGVVKVNLFFMYSLLHYLEISAAS